MEMRAVYLKNTLELCPYLSNMSGDSCRGDDFNPEERYHSFYTSLRKSDSRLILKNGEYL